MPDQINRKKLFAAGQSLRRIGVAMVVQIVCVMLYFLIVFGVDAEIASALRIVLVIVVFISSLVIIIAVFNAGESLIEAARYNNSGPIIGEPALNEHPIKNAASEIINSDPGQDAGMVIVLKNGSRFLVAESDLGFMNWDSAQAACQNYRGGGFVNWRLPDKHELSAMYNHKANIGGFKPVYYWCSNEDDSHFAGIVDFESGEAINYIQKDFAYHVRPVRTI